MNPSPPNGQRAILPVSPDEGASMEVLLATMQAALGASEAMEQVLVG